VLLGIVDMKKLLLASTMLSFLNGAAEAQVGNLLTGAPPSPGQQYNTVVFNCPTFVASGGIVNGVSCETTLGSFSSPYFVLTGVATAGLVGAAANVMPSVCQHCSGSLVYQTPVSVAKFQSTFQFVSNGWNISFVLNNTNNTSANGADFYQGAGCEAGIFQGSSTDPTPPNNIFAVLIDSFEGDVAGTSDFSDSSMQWGTPGVFAANAPNPPFQSPCNPNLGGVNFTYAGVNKIKTAPVHLNSPSNATFQTTCTGGCDPVGSGDVGTGDTYQETVTYDGNNVTATLFNVTAGGTCTPVTSGTCFTTTWSGINIPSIVGAGTAYVSITSGTANNQSTINQLVYYFSYNTP
jgi:hypothetical protein